ncbi:MAG: alpha/beta fold hydrolase [Cellvibrionales bacterium]|nr:alpha/beta fold hydrolase [Cellvibrionales bacterium]
MFDTLRLSIRDIEIEGKLWHKDAKVKVLALHGWLDNAASFDAIAPLMPECTIFAFDQAGNGCSEFRPASSTYHLWDDLLDCLAIADALSWDQFHVVGHSRGAMLSMLLSASLPKRVQSQILLDGLMPIPVSPEKSPEQLAGFLSQNSRPAKTRYYPDFESLLAARVKASGLSDAASRVLATRSIHQTDEGFYWRSDARLKTPSAIKMTKEMVFAMIAKVIAPTTLILADKGFGRMPGIDAQIQAFERPIHLHHVKGSHHWHLEGDLSVCQQFCRAHFVAYG